MDRGICNGCRSLSRISTVLVVVVVSLVLRSVSSIKLPEETCKPRPVVVSVTQDYRPYHITVYRCSGTCDANIPPSQKPCTAAKKKEIEVEFTGPLGQHHKTIKIYNHTSCSCECNLECNWAEGERLDGDNCRCLKGPSTDRFVGGQKTEDVLPYKIGLAALGFVTALILVLVVCTKRKQVLESVKKSCCKRDPPPAAAVEAAV
ncbi:uncharacterized protein LOC110061760 isoform X2 [Orbicella faveolata]|uniref:uncharacterized protein LOC110061760 isoform X2 n=1 Tax=Orbicella faveolata TaxID=48498 RepID=UPI0009E36183|nr:uncharacterized protein LOC110061760 isoform X2 [Orbicella faveolata]